MFHVAVLVLVLMLMHLNGYSVHTHVGSTTDDLYICVYTHLQWLMQEIQDLIKAENPIMDILLRTQIQDVKVPTQVQVLYAWNTVHNFIEKLQSTKYISFPVLDENDECIGLVDELEYV
uniref:CBS domain-containing protein n=1 Tax=Lygus hesperus TaxID=30085 RepID=A0A146MDH8_LYGHE